MKILLTGHMGFIGSHTLQELVGLGHDVICMDNAVTGRGSNLKEIAREAYVVIPRGDITDDALAEDGKTWVYRVIEEHEPEAIIHLAAQPSLLKSYDFPEYDLMVNGIGTLALVSAAREFGIERMVFSSTSAVYRNSQRMPLTESNSAVGPSRPYGISKYAAECYIRSLLPESIILRYGNVYGPRQVPLGPNQLVPRALAHIYNREDFFIYGDGSAVRDFIYVDDVAHANVVAVLDERGGGTYNISSGEGHSVNEVVNHIQAATNFRGYFQHKDPVENEPTEVILDNARARLFLEWHPRVGLGDGIERTAKWWRENMTL